MQPSSERISDKQLEINSCNIQYLSKGDYHMVRPKGRVDYHILYIMEGVCHVWENGKEHPVSAGNIILYEPGERQDYAFWGREQSVSAYVHFSGEAVRELLGACDLLGRRVSYVGEAKQPARIFREMVEEFCLKKPFWRENAAALFQHFLACAARQRQYESEGVNVALRHSMDEVLRYMHRHYAEDHDVAFYAAMCHLSCGRFAHAFKESTGSSPWRYVLRIRIDVALELLATTTLSVAEVATAVGVADVNYFSRLIKKHTGHTPRRQR